MHNPFEHLSHIVKKKMMKALNENTRPKDEEKLAEDTSTYDNR